MTANVKHFTKLMLERRGYDRFTERPDVINLTESKIKPDVLLATSKPSFEKNKNKKETLIVFFLTKNTCGEKITTNVFKELVQLANTFYHSIIVHESTMSLTPETKQNILRVNNGQNDKYLYEIFSFDELEFDLFEALFENKDDPDNIKFIPRIPDKFPILLCTDPLAKYICAAPGDFLSGRFGLNEDLSERRCIYNKN